MGSREESDSSSNWISVSSDLSASNTMGVEREVIIENREYPNEEIVKPQLLRKEGYECVNPFVRSQFSKFRWSRILDS